MEDTVKRMHRAQVSMSDLSQPRSALLIPRRDKTDSKSLKW